MEEEKSSFRYIKFFDDVRSNDVAIVGGKNASLGEMYRNLTKKGVSIPNGFAVTAYAYRYLLEKANIEKEIRKTLSDLNTNNINNLNERGRKVREIILKVMAFIPLFKINSMQDFGLAGE